jgi:hypothetical protein
MQEAREKRKRANAKLLRGLHMKTGFSDAAQNQMRREKLKNEQDKVAKRCLPIRFLIALLCPRTFEIVFEGK